MTAVAQDITLEQGATFRARITVNDSVGNPVNVSTFHATLTIVTSGESLLITDPTIVMGNGTIDLVVTDTNTDLMRPGLGNWDLFIVDPATNDSTKLYYGTVTVNPRVHP